MGTKGQQPFIHGSALNGGPDQAVGATGLVKLLGAAYADAKAASTTSWDLQT